jgi:MFS family permease
MTTQLAGPAASAATEPSPRPALTLTAALLGFFIVTLDAVVVNVALPTVQRDLGSGISGLQWVVDGYTLMFAALLLTSGVLADRIGARRGFAPGVIVFTLASLACGFAPDLALLVLARFVQGTAAAIMMPSSMALIGQLSLVMILVGLSGPLVMPPTTGVLLNSVHGHNAGTASGVVNTSRQIGGALAVAVFGTLLANSTSFRHGLRVSLSLAALTALVAAIAAARLRRH